MTFSIPFLKIRVSVEAHKTKPEPAYLSKDDHSKAPEKYGQKLQWNLVLQQIHAKKNNGACRFGIPLHVECPCKQTTRCAYAFD